MAEIKVDFTAGGDGSKREKMPVLVPINAKLKTILSLVFAVVGGAVAYYFMLPAFNLKALEMYEFFGIIIAIYIGSQFLLSGAVKAPEYGAYAKKKAVVPVIIGAVIIAFVLVGYLVSSVFFRASSYSKIISVNENKTFVSDIQNVDFSAVPVLDDAASSALAKRTLGDLDNIGLVSQFEVGLDFTQINYKNTPVRVTTLRYGNIFKWLKNTKNGLPGYIVVDMVTQKAALNIFEEGKYMRYSTYEHFGKYLMRHLRFNFPTYLFGSPTFEIDESGAPFWIVPVLDKTIGLFGGTDVKGAVLVDAITGEVHDYSLEDLVGNAELQWIDGIYSRNLLVEQYNYYGRYSNGFWNSIITQTGVKNATEGSNYLAINDDVYMYTGVTSVTSTGSDEAIIGFVLINMRTKEADFYKVSGTKEYSAAYSAEGAVQNFEYHATFPILLNISGQPTYFMSLKDDSNLVKMYAMVNVEQYQVVVTGSTISECTENYIRKLKENGITIKVDIDNIEDYPSGGQEDINTPETIKVKGVIADIRTAVIDGDSWYYIRLDDGDSYYALKASDNEAVIILNVGDKIKLETETNEGAIITAQLDTASK